MANKIRTLQDLHAYKKELKNKVTQNNPISTNALTSYLGSKNNSSTEENPLLALFGGKTTSNNSLMDEGVKALLTLGASALVTRFKLGTVPKLIATGAVALATPYIVGLIQKKFHKKEENL